MRFDLHIHSRYSDDSCQPVENILKIAKDRGLDGISITDHNTLAGSLEAMQKNTDPNFYVIPGIEYSTDQGHILAYCIEQEPDLNSCSPDSLGRYPWLVVVEAIHRAGGLAFLAHPFKRSPREFPGEIWQIIDGVEAYNSRAANGRNPYANQAAAAAAQKHNLPVSAGSDAHWPAEIGGATLELPGKPGQMTMAELRTLLVSGQGITAGVPGNIKCDLNSVLVKVWKTRRLNLLPLVLVKILKTCLKGTATVTEPENQDNS